MEYRMSDQDKSTPVIDTDFMINNAAGLLSIAIQVEHEGEDAFDTDRFYGSFQAAPILSALGIEIALKAWIYRDSKTPNKSHNLYSLFKQLDNKTMQLLEDAWQRGRGRGTHDDPIHDLVAPKRMLEVKNWRELIYPRPSNLCEILEEYQNVFVDWRYLHELLAENSSNTIQPILLNKVLEVLIKTYRKHPRIE